MAFRTTTACKGVLRGQQQTVWPQQHVLLALATSASQSDEYLSAVLQWWSSAVYQQLCVDLLHWLTMMLCRLLVLLFTMSVAGHAGGQVLCLEKQAKLVERARHSLAQSCKQLGLDARAFDIRVCNAMAGAGLFAGGSTGSVCLLMGHRR